MSSTSRRLFNLFAMIDYYRSNIVIEFFDPISDGSFSQILAVRLILYKMADSSATAAVGAVKRNQVKQSPSSNVKQHNANVLGGQPIALVKR